MRPSNFLGLPSDSYEAYCVDEAVIHFGMSLENELDMAGHRPSKEERKIKMAREVILRRVFGDEKTKGTGFADPALMFK